MEYRVIDRNNWQRKEYFQAADKVRGAVHEI